MAAQATKAIELAQNDFQGEVLDNETPVLVDFWAPWCPPCRILGPTVDEVAEQFAGRAKVVKVDVDGAQQLAASYSVRSIPTLMIFKGGQSVWQHTGLISASDLGEALESFLD